jgi:hypothetical protein
MGWIITLIVISLIPAVIHIIQTIRGAYGVWAFREGSRTFKGELLLGFLHFVPFLNYFILGIEFVKSDEPNEHDDDQDKVSYRAIKEHTLHNILLDSGFDKEDAQEVMNEITNKTTEIKAVWKDKFKL